MKKPNPLNVTPSQADKDLIKYGTVSDRFPLRSILRVIFVLRPELWAVPPRPCDVSLTPIMARFLREDCTDYTLRQCDVVTLSPGDVTSAL